MLVMLRLKLTHVCDSCQAERAAEPRLLLLSTSAFRDDMINSLSPLTPQSFNLIVGRACPSQVHESSAFATDPQSLAQEIAVESRTTAHL